VDGEVGAAVAIVDVEELRGTTTQKLTELVDEDRPPPGAREVAQRSPLVV
jgi:hypothetical protein